MDSSGPAMDADDAAASAREPWTWVPADGNFKVAIPDRERRPLPPSTELQGRYRIWRSTLYLAS